MPNAGPTVSNVQRLRVYEETTFGTDVTGSLGSFIDLPAKEGSISFSIPRESHDPGQLVQYHHDYREEVLGKKSCQISFTLPLHSTGTAAGDGVAAVIAPLGYLLKRVMGGESLGTGSTFVTGWSAVTGDLTSGAGFAKGEILCWENSSSVLECRPLKNLATNTATTKLAFSGSPANTDVAYSGATYYLASDPDKSLQFVVQGLESNDEWVLMGCQLESLTFTLPLDGTIPEVAFTFKGVDWLHGDDAAGTFSDITPISYSNFEPITGHAGRFMTQANGTTTYTGSTVNISAASFEPQLAYQPIPSPSGINGVLRWRLSRNAGPSIQGNFTTFFEDTSRFTDRDDRDDRLILYQIGTEAGKTVVFEASTVQYTDVQRADDNGIAGETVTWKGRRDGDVTSASGDAELSPFRIHLC